MTQQCDVSMLQIVLANSLLFAAAILVGSFLTILVFGAVDARMSKRGK